MSWAVPRGTKYIRFKYRTDSSGNGRGWYVHNPRLVLSDGDIVEPEWKVTIGKNAVRRTGRKKTVTHV